MNSHRPFLSTTIFTGLGRVVGMLIPFIIAYIFGAGPETDAFFFVYGIIYYLMGIFAHVFEAALIPYLAEKKEKSGEYVSCVQSLYITSLPGIVVFCLLIGGFLKYVLPSILDAEVVFIEAVPKLFFEMAPVLLFGITIAAINSIYFVQRKFWLPAVSPVLRALTAVIFIFALNQAWGIQSVTRGLVVGEILRWAVIFLALFYLTPVRLVSNWLKERLFVGTFFRGVSLQIFALIAINLVALTDHWFATWLGTGQLSLLNYADRLVQVFYLLFGASFLRILLADWSETYYRDHPKEFWSKVKSDVRATFMITLVLGVAMWFSRTLITALVYSRSDFSSEQLVLVSNVFGWLSIAIIPGAIMLLYGRVLFILKRNAVYCIQGWCILLMNVIFNYVLSKYYGLVGIAMATAAAYFIIALWLHYYVRTCMVKEESHGHH